MILPCCIKCHHSKIISGSPVSNLKRYIYIYILTLSHNIRKNSKQKTSYSQNQHCFNCHPNIPFFQNHKIKTNNIEGYVIVSLKKKKVM